MYRIMIVEDDDKIAEILGGHIGKYGYDSVLASDLKDIKGECLSLDPSLVILDINLPYYDGFYLDCLARRIGQVVAREDLLEALWDDVNFVDDNALTVNVSRVRRRLESMGIENAIETVRGQPPGSSL